MFVASRSRGSITPEGGVANGTQIQATPIVVDGVLYSTGNTGVAFAVHADNGVEIWKFDPYAGRRSEGGTNRGVVYWTDGSEKRILFTAGSRLYALNAATGALIPTFGTDGWIDLTRALAATARGSPWCATSPGVIYKDILIQGSRVGEGDGSAPGFVRAFDARTGAVRWMFPHDSPAGAKWVTTRGRPTHGRLLAARIHGAAWPWMFRAASSTSPPGLQHRTSTVVIALAPTSSRTRSSHSMPRRVSASGTIRRCIMISSIGIFPWRPISSRWFAMDGALMP